MFPTVLWLNEGYIRHLVCVCVCVCVWLGPVSGASLLWEDCWSVNMKRVCERLCVYMCHVCWQLKKTVSDRWTGSKWVSLDTRVHFSFQIHTVTHIYIFTHALNHTQTFPQRPTLNAQLWTAKRTHTHTHTHTHTRTHTLKGIVHTKNENSVIIHSTSCRAKPVWLSFFCEHKRWFFEEWKSVFCPYNESQ